MQPPPVASRARELGLDVIQPEQLHEDEVLAGSPPRSPRQRVCAYGALIKEPLLSAYEMLNVHPSLLPRWRGAAPVERAMMAGDELTGVSIMRVTEGWTRPGVPAGDRADHGRRRLRHAAARLQQLGGELLCARWTSGRRSPSRTRRGVTYATRSKPPTARSTRAAAAELERGVRALRRTSARVALPGGDFLGVIAARVAADGAAGGQYGRTAAACCSAPPRARSS